MDNRDGIGPANELHDAVMNVFGSPHPFTYEDVEGRYAEDFANLPQTFANVVKNNDYFHGTVDGGIWPQYEGEHVEALADLRDYLDEQDDWFLHRSFHSANSDIDRYKEAIPGLTDETLEEMYEDDLVSRHGGINIITDEGWWAIYKETGEEVYIPREETVMDPDQVVDTPLLEE